MKAKFVILSILILQSFGISHGQVESKHTQFAPNETIYVSVNSNMVFAGEYLYYSLFCFNSVTKELSNLSKVAYVALVDNNKDRVFQHKLKLENGRSGSDFFIPVSVETGNYKLIAYTNWMRNSDDKTFDTFDITIINPYKSNPTLNYVEEDLNADLQNNNEYSSTEYDSEIIELNKKMFDKREEVIISLNEIDNSSKFGSYCLSVHKVSDNLSVSNSNLKDFFKTIKSSNINYGLSNRPSFLPELRGEIVKGKLTSENDESSKNFKVAVSTGNEVGKFHISHVDESSNFYVVYDDYYFSNELYMDVIGNDGTPTDIKIEDKPEMDLGNLTFDTLRLNSSNKDLILERSIYNQIENAYFEFRSDSLYAPLDQSIFKDQIYEHYVLDDYTRFGTLKETVREFVKNTSIDRDSNGQEVFKIQGLELGSNSGIKPLIMVDGVVLNNHDELMDFNARTIEDIKVYRNQFVVDLHPYQGALVITTRLGLKENDFIKRSGPLKIAISKLEEPKIYYFQKYNDSNRDSRLPDFRQQLYWDSDLKMDKTNDEVSFFTSDVTGTFEVRLEGIAADGNPISISKRFTVN